ncbi:MAG: 50S ribosomal protein L25 [Candidatus Kerfeldbacteria bacterium]
MSEAITLKAVTREDKGRAGAGKVREGGMIPAIVYGKDKVTTPLSVNALDFERVLDQAGESTLIDLVIDDSDSVKVLVHDLQRHPVEHSYRHIDFYIVNMDEELTAEVEILFEGIAPAEKELGGIIVKTISELEVKCLPKDLPHHIVVDLTSLATFDDDIRVRDLPVLEGVEYLQAPDSTVVSVAEPRSEEELKALEEDVVEDISDVEVEGKKETDEEGETEETEAGEEKKEGEGEKDAKKE